MSNARIGILTISDRASRGVYEDKGGPALHAWFARVLSSPWEAVARVIDYGFDELELRRIFADTDPENRGSIGLLERLGFQREGRLRGEWETHSGVRDSLIYGLLRDEWKT